MITFISKFNRLGEDVKLPRRCYETAINRPGKGWKYPVYLYETECELEDSAGWYLDNRNTRNGGLRYTLRPMGLDFDYRLFNEIMNTTSTEAKSGIQAEAQQALTAPTETATFMTPTLTFGEVGTTVEQSTEGYLAKAKGVGHFEENRLVERACLAVSFFWNTTDTPGLLYLTDIDHLLRAHAKNKAVIQQFRYFRANIEVTVRLNTNQFYYGALLVNLWPGEQTGNWLDELAVLDPTVISASSAESVIKTWKYSWPFAWKPTADSSTPVFLRIGCLAPLTASPAMPDHITVQVWARFTDVELSYPCTSTITEAPKEKGKTVYRYEAQSANGSLMVRRAAKRGSNHPAGDPQSHAGGNPVGTMVSAVTDIATDAAGALDDLIAGGVGSVLGALSFLDKPDRADPHQAIINEASSDMYCSDIADSNVNVGTYKDRYVDPGDGRMPLSKAWTISQYSQIPGIRAQATIDDTFTPMKIPLLKRAFPSDSDTRTPLDYAFLNATMWRGAVKVMFQFFTSSFISARLVVKYINDAEYPNSFESDYTSGLARVINVKGDTIECLNLPWLSRYWWSQDVGPAIEVSLISNVASSDPAIDAKIYMVVWVAGGDDIQFAYPRTPFYFEWPYREVSISLSEQAKICDKKYEAQAAVHSLFEKKFEDIAENCFYNPDNGYCTGETLGLITDVCKRYGKMVPNSQFSNDVLDGGMLDNWYNVPDSGPQYGCWQAFRATFFGSWRAAFLFRSGGYRWRRFVNRAKEYHIQSSTSIETQGTIYCPPFDGTNRLTVPQLMPFPFGMLGVPNQEISIVAHDVSAGVGNEVVFVAARDDIQLGYPILPTGYPADYTPPEKGVEKEVAKPPGMVRGK